VIADSRTQIEMECRQYIDTFTRLVTPQKVTGEVPRAILRFGLVAAAGELATRYSLTGWKKGEAITAAEKCFTAWMEHRRSFDSDAKAVEHVRNFIIVNKAKFEVEGGETITDKVGHQKKSAYLILPEVFRASVCAGMKPEEVAEGLERAGYLNTSGKNRLKKQERINGSQVYVYSISSAILEAA
jgi:uncharacterized protein (DUF927 family)